MNVTVIDGFTWPNNGKFALMISIDGGEPVMQTVSPNTHLGRAAQERGLVRPPEPDESTLF